MKRAIAERRLSEMRGDAGLGLVEVVISLFMLAALSLAFIPILTQGIQQASKNATNATAVQLANQELELAQSSETCAQIRTFGNVSNTKTGASVTDPRGVLLQATRTLGACTSTATLAGTISVAITVTRSDTGATVASGTTLVYLKAGT